MRSLSFVLMAFLIVASGRPLFSQEAKTSPLAFTRPIFDQLDLKEIRKHRSQVPWEQALLSYFEAEAVFIEGKIHESKKIREQILKNCEGLKHEETDPKTRSICLLARLGFYELGDPKLILLQASEIKKELESFEKAKWSFEERAYLEMRTLWKLPPWLGGSASKSLLACESLIRLKPELTSPLFFKARILDELGETEKAQQNYRLASQKNPPDRRALFFLKAGVPQSRLVFGLLADPVGGVGVSVGKKEDRLWDSDRSLQVAISAQSRSVYRGVLFYQDRELFEKGSLQGFLLAAHERDQFFGLGPHSQFNQMTEIRQARSEGRWGWKTAPSPIDGIFSLGWFYREPLERVDLGYLNARQLSLIPSLQLGWGEKHKLKLDFRIFGSHKDFLSSHSFWGYELTSQVQAPLLKKLRGSLVSRMRGVSTQSPYGMLSDLGGNLSLPGVRAGRFKDTFGGYLLATLDLGLGQFWKLGIFGSLALLDSDLQKSLKQKSLGGGGAFVEYGKEPFQSRLELGHFANETIIQAGSRWVFE